MKEHNPMEPTLSQVMDICQQWRKKHNVGPTLDELHFVLTQKLHSAIFDYEIEGIIDIGVKGGVFEVRGGHVEVIGKL